MTMKTKHDRNLRLAGSLIVAIGFVIALATSTNPIDAKADPAVIALAFTIAAIIVFIGVAVFASTTE